MPLLPQDSQNHMLAVTGPGKREDGRIRPRVVPVLLELPALEKRRMEVRQEKRDSFVDRDDHRCSEDRRGLARSSSLSAQRASSSHAVERLLEAGMPLLCSWAAQRAPAA